MADTVAKHGILGLMCSQYFLASAYGIRVNVIAPWLVVPRAAFNTFSFSPS